MLNVPTTGSGATGARRATAARWLSIGLQSLVSILILGLGVGAIFALGSTQPKEEPPEAPPPPLVQTVRAEPHAEGITFSADGVVAPYRELTIAAEAAGRVQFKSERCRVGRTVAEGELLFEIDPRDYQLEVRRLEAELEQSRNTLAEFELQITSTENQIELAEENLNLEQREFERVSRLYERNAVSSSDVDTARRNLLNARTSLQTQTDQLRLQRAGVARLEGGVERITAQLELAKIAEQRTRVTAPIAGVITEESAEHDDYVAKGAVLCVLRDASRLDVQVSLKPQQMHWLWTAGENRSAEPQFTEPQAAEPQSAGPQAAEGDFPETPVEVIYQVGGLKYVWEGVLARYDGGGVDARTRMIPCRVHVTRPREVKAASGDSAALHVSPPTLMVGMFVEVRVNVRAGVELLRIPATAVHPGSRVWVVEAGKLSPRTVQIAGMYDDFALIYAQPEVLEAGTAVVVSPRAAPEAGAAVEERSAS